MSKRIPKGRWILEPPFCGDAAVGRTLVGFGVSPSEMHRIWGDGLSAYRLMQISEGLKRGIQYKPIISRANAFHRKVGRRPDNERITYDHGGFVVAVWRDGSELMDYIDVAKLMPEYVRSHDAI